MSGRSRHRVPRCTCLTRPDPQCRAHTAAHVEPEYLRWTAADDAAFQEAWLTMHDDDTDDQRDSTWRRVSDWLFGDADDPQEPWTSAIGTGVVVLVAVAALSIVLWLVNDMRVNP